MRLPPWLGRESASWQHDGLINEDQRLAILARYRPPLTAAQLVTRTLIWLAILSAGIGLVVLVARNWAAIPPPVRIGVATGGSLAGYAVAAVLARRGKPVESEYAALFAALLAGGAIFVIVEAAGGDLVKTPITLWWSGVLAITAAVLPSAITAGVGTAVALWWLLITGGSRDVPWEFLLVWPLLALAVQRDRDPAAAGGVALVFGCWSFFAALAVWRGQGVDTPAFVVALLAGAWLDALAHAPEARRPAFARAAPAMGFTALAITFLLPSSTHRALPDARLETSGAWMVLALVAVLAASAVRLSVAGRAVRWRPIAIVAACLAWLGLWLSQPGGHEAATAARWAWTLAFTATAVMVGGSAIRDFSISRDRGVFMAGILTVLITILVRAVDSAEGGVAAQAGILLASAGLLAWLARAARRAP